MAGDLIVSAGTLTDDQGNASGLTLRGSLTLERTGDIIRTRHDAIYAWAPDMRSNGTDVPMTAADTGVPRWSLADAATQRVKWTWPIPVGWEQVAVRFGWCNESTNSGNVVYTFAYKHIYLGDGDLNAGAVTSTISVAPQAAAGQYDFAYATPAELATITTPNGGLGDKPFMQCALSRLGSDGNDTLAGAVGVFVATATRVA